jgi:hypothetical protein
VQQSSATYQTIWGALKDAKAGYAKKSFDVFLQGSYGNHTNIFAESDVDVVIRLDSTFQGDVKGLPADQQAAYHQAYPEATYTFEQFKAAVVTQLSNAFGSGSISAENKAIKIRANGARRSADVVTCYQYRQYHWFGSREDQGYTEGIIFPTQSSGEVINYPKLHSDNCTAKHQATSQKFKPLVRIVKNMRSWMVDQAMIGGGTAPSYYIEGLLWNVPNGQFGGSYGDTFCRCIRWLWQTDRSQLWCANQQYLLLGASNVQWATADCNAFLGALVNLWDSW